MKRPPQTRVAIGIVENTARAEHVVSKLQAQGLACDRIFRANAATPQVFAGLTVLSGTRHPAGFAARLDSLREGQLVQPSLYDALSGWLPAKHAGQLDTAVRLGRTLVWVPLREPTDELAACTVLLHEGCDTVQVHDLSQPPVEPEARSPVVRATGWSARC